MLCRISNLEQPQRRQRTTGTTSLADSDMEIAELPSDILVEVTASIATRSTTPLIDIINLRRSCKVFGDATTARKVGRCMAVHREWRLQAVRGERQPRGILHPWIGGVLQPEEEGERAPAPPPRHGARPRRRGLHDRDDHVARLAALAGRRRRAGAGMRGLGLRRVRILWRQDKAQDGFRAQGGRVGHAKADDAPVEDGRGSDGLLESVLRQGGGAGGGGLGRGRRRGEVVLQPDLQVETRVL